MRAGSEVPESSISGTANGRTSMGPSEVSTVGGDPSEELDGAVVAEAAGAAEDGLAAGAAGVGGVKVAKPLTGAAGLGAVAACTSVSAVTSDR